jgi:hypothetical protein
MGKPASDIEGTKHLMGALVRQSPKPHEDMKVGKSKKKVAKSPAEKRARGVSSKPKTA